MNRTRRSQRKQSNESVTRSRGIRRKKQLFCVTDGSAHKYLRNKEPDNALTGTQKTLQVSFISWQNTLFAPVCLFGIFLFLFSNILQRSHTNFDSLQLKCHGAQFTHRDWARQRAHRPILLLAQEPLPRTERTERHMHVRFDDICRRIMQQRRLIL